MLAPLAWVGALCFGCLVAPSMLGQMAGCMHACMHAWMAGCLQQDWLDGWKVVWSSVLQLVSEWCLLFGWHGCFIISKGAA